MYKIKKLDKYTILVTNNREENNLNYSIHAISVIFLLVDLLTSDRYFLFKLLHGYVIWLWT
jgi:sRNA-binding regulator protein Hfq